MKGAAMLLVLGGALVAAGFLGMYDALGITSSDVKDGVGQGAEVGTGAWSQLTSQPWGYAAIGSGIAAALGIALWKRIGGFGRGAAILLAGISLGMIFFVR